MYDYSHEVYIYTVYNNNILRRPAAAPTDQQEHTRCDLIGGETPLSLVLSARMRPHPPQSVLS